MRIANAQQAKWVTRRSRQIILTTLSVLVLLAALRVPLEVIGGGCCQHATFARHAQEGAAASLLATPPSSAPQTPQPVAPSHCLLCHVPPQVLITILLTAVFLLATPLRFRVSADDLQTVFVKAATPPPRPA